MLVTYTGRTFDFNNITKDSIHIPDVLHSLPRINRFIGHSSRPYSVGEHTYLGLIIAERFNYTPLQKLQWFIHDFTEAYIGDCPTPLKRILSKFGEIEELVELAILEHLGLEPLTDEEYRLVKRIDATMLVVEMRDLTHHEWRNFINDYTYDEILEDEYFKLNVNAVDDKVMADILEDIFHELMEGLNV